MHIASYVYEWVWIKGNIICNNYFRGKTRCILIQGIRDAQIAKEQIQEQLFLNPPGLTWLQGQSDDWSSTSTCWWFSLLFTQAPLGALQSRIPPAHGTQHESQSQTASLLRGDVTNGEGKGNVMGKTMSTKVFLRQRRSKCIYEYIKGMQLTLSHRDFHWM